MRLRYSSRARLQIDSITDFLIERNPSAARRIAAEIIVSARSLLDFPHKGRPGDSEGTREWVVRGTPYVIVYEVLAENSEVWVLGVFHGAQDRQHER